MDSLWNAQYGVAPALALALLQSVWQDALLAITAAMVLTVLSRSSAALRHTIGMGFLLAMVLVPATTFVGFWRLPATDVNAGLLPAISAPVVGALPSEYVQQSSPLASALALLWMLGAALMLIRQFGGWRVVGALDKRPFDSLPPEWQQRALALQARLGITRTVVIRLAHDVVSPFTARFLRPVIWLPMSLLSRLPVEQIEALLAHELAHIRRLDWLWNGLQCVLESLLFFHPGAWWLSRRIRQERELACDDLAVAACGDAIALAEALTELERDRHTFPRLVLAAQGGSLMNRITRLLSGSKSRSRWRIPLAVVVLLCSGTLLATQVDIAGNSRLPSVHIVSSTDGILRPGDVREITTTGLDGKHYYRASVDAKGMLTEVYKLNDRLVTIDERGRDWIGEMTRLSVPPPPPAPAPPPPPPAPPALPPPPAIPAPPPPPPALADSTAFKAILRLVAADKGVMAAVGTPVVMSSEPVQGDLRLSGYNDRNGHARLQFGVTGPNGSAIVHVDAKGTGNAWQLDNVILRSGR